MAEQPSGPKQPFWNRPFSKRQTIIAYGAAGWACGFATMFFGDYQLHHHFPSILESLEYAAFGAFACAILCLGS